MELSPNAKSVPECLKSPYRPIVSSAQKCTDKLKKKIKHNHSESQKKNFNDQNVHEWNKISWEAQNVGDA